MEESLSVEVEAAAILRLCEFAVSLRWMNGRATGEDLVRPNPGDWLELRILRAGCQGLLMHHRHTSPWDAIPRNPDGVPSETSLYIYDTRQMWELHGTLIA